MLSNRILKNSVDGELTLDRVEAGNNEDYSESQTKSCDLYTHIVLKTSYAIGCSLRFGLGLMLMLVAMTENPLLFLALMVGYAIGEYLFLDTEQRVTKPYDDID